MERRNSPEMKLFLTAFTMTSAILLNFPICATARTVHGCKNTRVMLDCGPGTVLISDVILARSRCRGNRCCPRDNDCRGAPSGSYRNEVMNACNGKSSCAVRVEIRNIGCSVSSNDYANITHECQAAVTTVAATSRLSPVTARVSVFTESSTTEVPTMASSTVTRDTALFVATKKDERDSAEATVDLINDQAEMTTSAEKTGLKVPSPRENEEALKQSYKDEPQTTDRTTIVTALIVGGVVIVTTVISAAVVMALKKRRIPKTEQSHYDLPVVNCSAANDEREDDRINTNFYDFIQDFKDSGGCASREEGETSEENEYLKPMMEEEEQHPYDQIP